jgi:hypothetical protein
MQINYPDHPVYDNYVNVDSPEFDDFAANVLRIKFGKPSFKPDQLRIIKSTLRVSILFAVV